MQNAELISELKANFSSLKQGVSAQMVGELIRGITRSINRLTTENKELNLQLIKIAADLTSTYTSELKFQELKNQSENPGLKVKPEFESSFFESLAILRTQLFALLEKL